MKKYLMFDLDGTLTDPKIGITKSVQHSLKYFNINEEIDSLESFIGPPLRDSYKKFYGFNDESTEIAVKMYREYYNEKGIYENVIYNGIDTMLLELSKSFNIILATSKPFVYAEKILEYFNIHKYFSFIAGSELDGTRSVKSELIQYAIDNMNIIDTNEIIMIGDREHDIIGAKFHNITAVGVLYGYGVRDELAISGADYIVSDVGELTMLLKNEVTK